MKRWIALFLLALFVADLALCCFDADCRDQAAATACQSCACHWSLTKQSTRHWQPAILPRPEFVAVVDIVPGRQDFVKFIFHPPRILA